MFRLNVFFIVFEMATNMTNQFVYIVGPPGVGKYTVASTLAARMPAKLVDNHYWSNPIFGLIQQDGITPHKPTL
jgi:Holliday junction resolvasome RuvABC ATP-dependent DNA helicase subunit